MGEKGFQKGNKHGEASKRGPAKATAELKEKLRAFFEDKFEEFYNEETWSKLPTKEKLNFLSGLLPYIQPKLAPTDLYGLKGLSTEDLQEIVNAIKEDRDESDKN